MPFGSMIEVSTSVLTNKKNQGKEEMKMDMSILDQVADVVVDVCIWCFDNILMPIYEYVIPQIIEMLSNI